ncbi:oxamate carbamoyltransferase subunit AllH family protein [Nocardioides pyridinolyticus]
MMRQLVPVVVGSGVAAAHEDGALGTVVGAFRHGFYVQADGRLYAVAGPSVPPGPIHLILGSPPVSALEGLTVWLDGGLLCSTAWRIALTSAPVYAPVMPGPTTLGTAAPYLGQMLDRLTVPPDLRSSWDQVRQAVAAGDLLRIRALLEGRGGGLTPTGDDVLSGVLLVHAWKGGDRHRLGRVAEEAATTNLSRSFLGWAARGQSIAPVHDLMAHAAQQDVPGFEEAFATVSAIGGSSGIALLWGIGLAAGTVTTVGAVSPTG